MNWYHIFYWLTVSDSVKHFTDVASNIFTVASVLTFIAYLIGVIGVSYSISDNNSKSIEEDNTDPDIRSWGRFKTISMKTFYVMLPLAIITWSLYVLVPSKKDCLLIITGGAVGNFITSDSSAKALPSDLTKYLHLSLNKEINDLGSDTREELGLSTPKEKLNNKLKDLTKDQIIEFFKNDSTFIK